MKFSIANRYRTGLHTVPGIDNDLFCGICCGQELVKLVQFGILCRSLAEHEM